MNCIFNDFIVPLNCSHQPKNVIKNNLRQVGAGGAITGPRVESHLGVLWCPEQAPIPMLLRMVYQGSLLPRKRLMG